MDRGGCKLCVARRFYHWWGLCVGGNKWAEIPLENKYKITDTKLSMNIYFK